MESTEYQTRLKELNRRLLAVETKKCEVGYIDLYNNTRTARYSICQINGTRYVLAKDVAYTLVGRRKTNIKNGYLKESDMPYFYSRVYNREQVCLFINIGTLLEEDKLSRVILDDFYFKQAKAVISHAMKESVENVVVSAGDFERGQQAYRDILKLKKEMREFKAEQDYQREVEREREQEERRIEEGRQEEKTLRDLVGQIEAMGWQVTLSLKR